MESLIHKLFITQWQRKLLALFTATVIWIFVNYSITATKMIPSVPIRVINLPTDQTIQGLLPNGFLTKRTTLTLSGTKDVIDQLEPGDLEVILDVSKMSHEGIVQITKNNLVSLNPNFNLSKHITSVTYPEFVLKMSPILSEKIPVVILPPLGSPPEGYEFLDIWPASFLQTVSGPQDEVLKLKTQRLELIFNLNDITKEQLDALKGNGLADDEIAFPVPELWKKVNISFSNRGASTINDPDAKKLYINFLRKNFIPLKEDLPIHIFYPLKNSASINPETYALASSPYIQFDHAIPILKLPLFAYNVSALFLGIIKDNIELDIITAPPNEREQLEWSVEFIDSHQLEDTYAAFMLSNFKTSGENQRKLHQQLEEHFRKRFRIYMRNFSLYLTPQYKLEIESRLENGKIRVHIPNAALSIKPAPIHAD